MKAIKGLFLFSSCVLALSAQVSKSAYRVLGQLDFRQNGVNMVQGLELNGPLGVALDLRGGPVHVYIADTNNSRVLAWSDLRSYQIGDAPALVLGQPGPQYSAPLGIGVKGFNLPASLAVDPKTGNLYVADYGNNRVLRFPNPFSNPSRVEPDAVYGQPSFNSNTANFSGVSRNSVNKPRGVAFDSAGNLWVADTGNHRILRFPAASLDSVIPPDADMVVGQKDFTGGAANRGSGAISASGFDTPFGLTFDVQNNLYVADFNNARVLKFSALLSPSAPDPAASAVIGQANFTTRGVPAQPSSSTLAGPTQVAVDPSGNLYVAVPNDNRVLTFPAGANAASNVLGQADFLGVLANANVFPKASANTLYAPSDVKVDATGNVFVVDSGNNRVLGFPARSKSATLVWGQSDFSSNGVNQIKPGSINAPYKMAVDYSSEPFALYVSDTNNNRVLVWKDAARFRSGDPADLVVGQPDLLTAIANVDSQGSRKPSQTSLFGPKGIAVDAAGNLYVADSGNNRILRYPKPVKQTGRITPDVLIGQADFTSSVSAVVNAASLNSPAGLALGPDGDLFVADSGNNRVVEFAAGAGSQASAIRVYGQPNLNTSTAPGFVSAQTLNFPLGVYVDSAFNLFVADTGAKRALVFPNTQVAPPAGLPAAFVIGQSRFDTLGGGGTKLSTPVDIALDSSGNIYVSDNSTNRLVIFPSLAFLPVTGAVATDVIGQYDLSGTAVNWDSTDGLATPEGMYGPLGIYIDRRDTLYVGDSGNNRVLNFLKGVSVVNAAHLQSGVPVAQSGLATLFGTGLADGSDTASTAPWPTALLNREVVINDQIKASLVFLNSSQVNLQVPSATPVALNRIAIRLADTAELVAGGTFLAAASSPGLFTSSGDGTGQGAVLNQDNSLNGPSNPAARGSIVVLFGTGQGQVSPPVQDGMPASSQSRSVTVAVPTSDGKTCVASQPSVCVAIGSTFGDIQFSGLAPNLVGVWQINLKIPQTATPGSAVPVRALIDGVPSNLITIAIK